MENEEESIAENEEESIPDNEEESRPLSASRRMFATDHNGTYVEMSSATDHSGSLFDQNIWNEDFSPDFMEWQSMGPPPPHPGRQSLMNRSARDSIKDASVFSLCTDECYADDLGGRFSEFHIERYPIAAPPDTSSPGKIGNDQEISTQTDFFDDDDSDYYEEVDEEVAIEWKEIDEEDPMRKFSETKDATQEGTSAKDYLITSAKDYGVHIRPDYLSERIKLEKEMLYTILKFTNFLVYFVHFLLSMYEFCPAQHLSMVHRQISEHFHLSLLNDVQTFTDVYDFMEEFEHQNEELQATSYHFWCEKRYFSLTWNAHLGIPEKHCYSPRLGALGAALYDAYSCPHCHGAKWADWKMSGDEGHGADSSAGHGSASNSHGSASTGKASSHGSASTSDNHGSASTSDSHGSGSPSPSGDGNSASSSSHGSSTASAAPASSDSGSGSSDSGHGSSSDTHGSSASSSSHDRRLRGEVSQEIKEKVRRRKLSGRSLAIGGCKDFDDLLEEKEKIPGITCENHASMVCDLEAGLLLCEKTCGYCPPFEYIRTRKFERPMLTLLPVVVFQERYPIKPCKTEEYVTTYNGQSTNPNLVILPTLDGERSDQLLRCLDHSTSVEGPYAHSTECPKDHCSDGFFKDTPKSEFHGVTIYPKILIEPHKDVLGMRHIEWLDFQTKDVSLSTMIYTEDLEIFTSATIVFSVQKSGQITASKKLQSYKEFHHDEKILFVTNCIIVIVSSGLGVFASIYLLVKHKKKRDFVHIFELISRSCLCGFVIYFFIAWSSLKPMHDEFDELIHSFLDVEANPEEIVEELSKTTHRFFEVKTHIYEENRWVDTMRITGFLMLYLQFVQIILYLNVHPRMALLTRTLGLALDSIVHWGTLFLTIFIVLAYMVHWLLGGDLFEVFGTFSTAFMSQTRMIFGEWIHSDGVDDLHGVWLSMYWVWAATFLLLVFFVLMNFFLAIIVDSFAVVKELIEKQVTECSFPFDLYDAFASTQKFQSKHWPSRDAIIHVLEQHIPVWGNNVCKTSIEIDADHRSKKPSMRSLELLTLFGSKEKVDLFVAYYTNKVPEIQAPPKEVELVDDGNSLNYAALLALAPKRKVDQVEAFFKNGAEAAIRKFVRSITEEVQGENLIDWDHAVGRVIRTMHQELETKRGHADSKHKPAWR